MHTFDIADNTLHTTTLHARLSTSLTVYSISDVAEQGGGLNGPDLM
jgi:hypothetical protein